MANDNKINIGDTWKSISDIQINISDTWKSADAAYINIGDTWKQFWPSAAWVAHFDNSDWQIESISFGGLGSWDGSEWDSENYFSFLEGVELGELGTWNVGYRPTKMRVTYTGGGSGIAISGSDRAQTSLIIAEGSPGSSYPYQSGDEIILDWTGDFDLEIIMFIANNGDTFSITNIEFYEE